ncbi:MAG: hypothetical protein M1822_002574 [Bathelium mastoideum]|nr:MAG: hypothetical protein M1822_002574 [Bathelium mastoideum]
MAGGAKSEPTDQNNGNTGRGGGGYETTARGINDQGNRWDSRDYGPGTNDSYHYSNRDGSYYYSNPDKSTYYNNGDGYARYTAPGGSTHHNSGKGWKS